MERVRAEIARRGPRIVLLDAPGRWDGRRRASSVAGDFSGVVRTLSAEVGGGEFQRAGAERAAGIPPGSWGDLFAEWLSDVENDRRDTLWWISDPDRVEAAAWEALVRTWSEVRSRALPVQLLVSDHRPLRVGGFPPSIVELDHRRLQLHPPGLPELAEGMAQWAPDRRLAAAVIFGQDPGRWRRVDPSVRLSTNVQRLLLDPDGPLWRAELDRVQQAFQRPERFISVVQALARGPAEWGTLSHLAPGIESGSQLGPYLAGLEEQGFVSVDRSLDAPPRSRARRYGLIDSHSGFWFGCILPIWSRVGLDRPSDLWSGAVRPALAGVADWAFPALLREWLATDGAERRLSSRGREIGGLWGEGYDFPVAAAMTSGAVLYGQTRWARGDVPGDLPGRMKRELGATRYGFAREARHRLIVQRDPPSHDLARRVARDDSLILLSARDLVGD